MTAGHGSRRGLARPEVERLLGVSPRTLDRLRKRPDFPQPRMFGVGCRRWLEDELVAWMSAQPAAVEMSQTT